MDEIINSIYEIIKDYRADDGFVMNHDKIKEWVEQFDELDRIFVLEELRDILEKRYISKSDAQRIVKEMIEFLSERRQYQNPKDFLMDCHFIDHQPEGKSQKILLRFVDEIIKEVYGISIQDCVSNTPKYFLYFDDILCTGDTLYKGLTKNEKHDKGWFFQVREDGKTNKQYFEENNPQMIWVYFAIHKYNVRKLVSRFNLTGFNFRYSYAWEEQYAVDNDWENSNSYLEYLYPLKPTDEEIISCEKQIDGKMTSHNSGYVKKPPVNFYRSIGSPKEEVFFSSPENRNRFETIILKKCIEIYRSSPTMQTNSRAKPLGYGLYSDHNFGFGTLIFTWRNVPLNVPLIFWYRHNGFKPLFERNFTSYDKSLFTFDF